MLVVLFCKARQSCEYFRIIFAIFAFFLSEIYSAPLIIRVEASLISLKSIHDAFYLLGFW